jgi:hypothetical protein
MKKIYEEVKRPNGTWHIANDGTVHRKNEDRLAANQR